MLRNTFILAGLAAATGTGAAMAQVALPPNPAPPIGVITQDDAVALNEVLQTTIPPRYAGGIVKWFTDLTERHHKRQQAAAPPAPDEPKN